MIIWEYFESFGPYSYECNDLSIRAMPLLSDTSSQEIICGWIQAATLINERKMVLSTCKTVCGGLLPIKNSFLDNCHLSPTSLVSNQDKELA